MTYSLVQPDFLKIRGSGNVGVIQVISPNGSNSFELKKRKKIARFEVGALFLFQKSCSNV